jgi:hypothetical protein
LPYSLLPSDRTDWVNQLNERQPPPKENLGKVIAMFRRDEGGGLEQVSQAYFQTNEQVLALSVTGGVAIVFGYLPKEDDQDQWTDLLEALQGLGCRVDGAAGVANACWGG